MIQTQTNTPQAGVGGFIKVLTSLMRLIARSDFTVGRVQKPGVVTKHRDGGGTLDYRDRHDGPFCPWEELACLMEAPTAQPGSVRAVEVGKDRAPSPPRAGPPLTTHQGSTHVSVMDGGD